VRGFIFVFASKPDSVAAAVRRQSVSAKLEGKSNMSLRTAGKFIAPRLPSSKLAFVSQFWVRFTSFHLFEPTPQCVCVGKRRERHREERRSARAARHWWGVFLKSHSGQMKVSLLERSPIRRVGDPFRARPSWIPLDHHNGHGADVLPSLPVDRVRFFSDNHDLEAL